MAGGALLWIGLWFTVAGGPNPPADIKPCMLKLHPTVVCMMPIPLPEA